MTPDCAVGSRPAMGPEGVLEVRYTCTRVHTRTQAHTYVHTHTYTHTRTHTQIYTYKYIHANTNIHKKYIHKYTHTITHYLFVEEIWSFILHSFHSPEFADCIFKLYFFFLFLRQV